MPTINNNPLFAKWNAVKDSGQREEFPTGSVRDSQIGKGRFDLLPIHALFRLAKHFEAGAAKYSEENWRKGQDLRRYCNSAIRHLLKYMGGLRDEDHLAAAIWNLCCLLETEQMIKDGQLPKELNNLPKPVLTETNH